MASAGKGVLLSVVVRFSGPRAAQVRTVADLPLGPGQVRVQTIYSGISAGTELTAYRGSNPYLSKHWDEHNRMFVDGESTIAYPVEGPAYEEVGRIAEAADDVQGVSLGDIVFGTWGHRSSALISGEYAAARVLPPGTDPIIGIFAHIGAIALNAVLDADIHVGETVAVFGQGVPGQIVAQLARLNGGEVIAVDPMTSRLELARKLGAQHVLDATDPQSVAARVKHITGGRGADVSIEISGVYAALQEAIRATAYNSRVVCSGFFQGGGSALLLGEEFHHNRIAIVCSQISGVSPELSHRWDQIRLQRTVMQLAASGRIDLLNLVSHRLPVEHAAQAFQLLDLRPTEAMQVVLTFQD
jgi:2-desacetyl-2-hydroxyethyl bacteriochlorophyllide A dehydrogenase